MKIEEILYWTIGMNRMSQYNQEQRAININKIPEEVEKLFDEIEKKQLLYLLVGGIAMYAYNTSRRTEDIDFIMPSEEFNKIDSLEIRESPSDFLFAQTKERLKIDILLTNNNLFRSIYNNPEYNNKKNYGNRVINTVTPEGLIILKLYALPSLYRQMELEKIDKYLHDIQFLVKFRFQEINEKQVFDLLKKELLEVDLEIVREIYREKQEERKKMLERQKKFKNILEEKL